MRVAIMFVAVVSACGRDDKDLPSLRVSEIGCVRGELGEVPKCLYDLEDFLSGIPDRIVQIVVDEGAGEDDGPTRRLFVIHTRAEDLRWPRGSELHVSPLRGPIVNPAWPVITFRETSTPKQYIARPFPAAALRAAAKTDPNGWSPVSTPPRLQAGIVDHEPRVGFLMFGRARAAWFCDVSAKSVENRLKEQDVRPACQATTTPIGRITKCTGPLDDWLVFRGDSFVGTSEKNVGIDVIVREIALERRCDGTSISSDTPR